MTGDTHRHADTGSPHYNDPEGNCLPDLMAFPLDRVMYGSDFPNIPYAWDRELKWLKGADLCSLDMERITWRNAARFFNLDLKGPHGG